MLFDFVFANSYIDLKYDGRVYLSDSYDTLSEKMRDKSDTITVHALDFIGIFDDVKTFKKEDIIYYDSY